MLTDIGSKLASKSSVTDTNIAIKAKDSPHWISGVKRTVKTVYQHGKGWAKQWKQNEAHQGRNKVICSR